MPSDAETRLQISDAIEQVSRSLRDLRESVVLRVMQRNKLQDEVTRLERLITDLDNKAGVAEKLNNARLATELRAERSSRNEELARLRPLLTKSEAEAEAAKVRLPEEEARLVQQFHDLKAQSQRLTANAVQANAPGGLGTNADDMWERASGKIADLRREASARDEVLGARSGQTSGPQYSPQTAPISPDQSAEQMLAAMDGRLGLPSALPQDEVIEKSGADFLEFDPVPTAANPAEPNTDVTASAIEVTAPPTRMETPLLSILAPLESIAPRTYANFATRIKGDTARMEPTERVRVAAIGTGNIFRGAHLPCYPDIAQAQLVALCDPDKSAQDQAYKKYQTLMEAKIKRAQETDDIATIERLERDLETVQICDDISEVIETVKPDLVDICTQPLLHTPLAIQALEAGFHVMCEKPLSRSWLESKQLVETIQRTGKFYQHNENWLFDPDYYTVKKLVDSGAIGELAMMFLTQAHGGPEGNPKFWNSDFGGGGALLDNGIHAIGAAWFIAGLHKTPTLVKAAAPYGMSTRMPQRIIDGKFQDITVDDDAHILIRFEDSKTNAWTTAHVEGSWSEQDSPDTAYIGTTGSIKMLDEDGKRYAVVCDIKGRETRRFRVAGSNWQHWPSSFYGEILNMVQCVRNNQQSIMTAQFGADCSAIVGASYLSEKNGRRAVSLDEFRQFATGIGDRYPNDPKAANDALVDELLAAVRK